MRSCPHILLEVRHFPAADAPRTTRPPSSPPRPRPGCQRHDKAFPLPASLLCRPRRTRTRRVLFLFDPSLGLNVSASSISRISSPLAFFPREPVMFISGSPFVPQLIGCSERRGGAGDLLRTIHPPYVISYRVPSIYLLPMPVLLSDTSGKGCPLLWSIPVIELAAGTALMSPVLILRPCGASFFSFSTVPPPIFPPLHTLTASPPPSFLC